MLATKLNMSPDSAERWIVNLIRNAKLDAKIDAKEVWGEVGGTFNEGLMGKGGWRLMRRGGWGGVDEVMGEGRMGLMIQ